MRTPARSGVSNRYMLKKPPPHRADSHAACANARPPVRVRTRRARAHTRAERNRSPRAKSLAPGFVHFCGHSVGAAHPRARQRVPASRRATHLYSAPIALELLLPYRRNPMLYHHLRQSGIYLPALLVGLYCLRQKNFFTTKAKT